MIKILVVDDEVKLGRLVAEMLELQGYEVEAVRGGRAAIERLDLAPPDIVISDLRMPEVDGMEVLRKARSLQPAPDVVMMTAHGTTDNAVAAMRLGAADYLTKPFAMDELRLRIGRLSEQRQREAQTRQLVDRLASPPIAASPAMRRVLEETQKVANSEASVLLLGESGTGKSRLARYIHFASKRASGPLVEVHCAALPEALLESELFGYEKGAFTGAVARKEGHLKAAHGGTLFLDEIGDITSATQLKLLRFLQEREFVPLGATVAEHIDVRVVAATNRDLQRAVADGAFREDLYYRLNVFTISVPPLRARPEDIAPLADRFLSGRGVPLAKLGERARGAMLGHPWPGNVRELENVLERSLILSGEDEIAPEHLGTLVARAAPEGAPTTSLLTEGFNLDAFELELIHEAIERSGGNKTQAARILGITRRRLYSRLKSLEEKGDRLEEPHSGDG